MEPIRRELTIDATEGNLAAAQEFVESVISGTDCPMKPQMMISLAVEEIFINIASYAYAPKTGEATITAELQDHSSMLVLTFRDRGIPYDPVAKEDPNLHVPVEEREIGGLGIYMTKKIMDAVLYEYRDGQNVLTLKKNLV